MRRPDASPSTSHRLDRAPLVVPVLVAALTITLLAGGAPAAGQPGALDVLPPRIAGADRVATAEAVATVAMHPVARPPESVVVVPRDATAVALAVAGLTGRLDTTTLLSDLPPRPSTIRTARQLGATHAVVVGGGPQLVAAWDAAGFAATGIDADGGPPAVAAAVGRVLVDDAPGRVLLAGTGGLPDALAAGPLAHRDRLPLLLTARDRLDPHTRFLLAHADVPAVTVLGGPAVVSDEVVAELRAMGLAVDRLAGADRERTALAVAQASPPAQAVLLAAEPADAATAAALAVRTGAVVLPPGPVSSAWLAQRCGSGPPLVVIGGVQAVPEAAESAHRAALQRCGSRSEPMVVRVGVAAPGADGGHLAELVLGDGGWGSRRLRLIGVGESPHVRITVGPAAVCGGAAACRRGPDLLVDGGAWAAAAPDRRAHLVDLLVGSWLGEPVGRSCSGQVMDPLGCPPPGRPSEERREATADRFVPTATLAFAGDVHGERHIATAVHAGRNPLAPVAAVLSAADVAVLNLETPLSTRGTPVPKTYTFRGPPELAEDLAEAGVDVVSLANNHALDHGVVAMRDTLVHAEAAGLRVVGAGEDPAAAYAPAVVDTPAGRVAIVGVTRVLHTRTWEAAPGRPGLASAYDERAAVAAVQAARDVADVVVVAIHWGTERADCPDGAQRHLARVLTDAGADVIVGHHPHVLQGVQVLGGPADPTLVAYSMGNFVWYHDRAPSRTTGILQVELPLLDDPSWSFVPAEIRSDGSPHPVDGPVAAATLQRITDRSTGGAVGCAFPAG